MPIHRRAMLKTSLASLGAWAAANAWTTTRGDEPKASGRLLVHNREALNNGKAGFGFSGLVLVNPSDGTWQKLSSQERFSRLSPDGKRLAMVSRPEPGAKLQLRVGPLDAEEPPKSVAEFEGDITSFPVWSADGKAFVVAVYGRREDGSATTEVFRVGADGTGLEPLAFPELSHVFDWSPDGERFLVNLLQYPPGHVRPIVKSTLALLRPDGSIIRHITERGGSCARFSPDGRRILYSEKRDDGLDLWVEPTEPGERRRIPVEERRAIQACWSPDGRSIAVGTHKVTRGRDGTLVVSTREPVECEIAIVEADGDGSLALPLPGGLLTLNDWR
jgi:dipeptidyl aminopeptidase/acylaminoacyl peptidase